MKGRRQKPFREGRRAPSGGRRTRRSGGKYNGKRTEEHMRQSIGGGGPGLVLPGDVGRRYVVDIGHQA